MRKIVALRVLENYRIWLRFDDDASGEVDFSDKPLTGVYAPWRNYDFFRQAHIDPDGQLAWDTQVDFSAESLRRRLVPDGSLHRPAQPAHA